MYVCIFIHTYVDTYIYVCIKIHTYIYMYIFICIHTYTYILIYVYIYIYIRIYVYIYVQIYVSSCVALFVKDRSMSECVYLPIREEEACVVMKRVTLLSLVPRIDDGRKDRCALFLWIDNGPHLHARFVTVLHLAQPQAAPRFFQGSLCGPLNHTPHKTHPTAHKTHVKRDLQTRHETQIEARCTSAGNKRGKQARETPRRRAHILIFDLQSCAVWCELHSLQV